jgi:hypothetical protein
MAERVGRLSSVGGPKSGLILNGFNPVMSFRSLSAWHNPRAGGCREPCEDGSRYNRGPPSSDQLAGLGDAVEPVQVEHSSRFPLNVSIRHCLSVYRGVRSRFVVATKNSEGREESRAFGFIAIASSAFLNMCVPSSRSLWTTVIAREPVPSRCAPAFARRT